MKYQLFLPIWLAGATAAQALSSSAERAQAVLTASCYGCHGQPPHKPVAGLDILDVAAMTERGLLVPGSPDFSLPFQYLSEGYMPPAGDTFPDGTRPKPPSADDIAAIKAWIEDGAPAFNNGTSADPKPPAYGAVVKAALDDLRTVPAADQARIRYVSLAHLAGTELRDQDLTLARQGLVKFLNSVSINPVLAQPHPIDAAKLIFRVDLRDLGWVPATWRILEGSYPFSLKNPATVAAEGEIASRSGARLPFVRGDWLVGTASRAPLYYDILFQDLLGIPGKKRATALLEGALGIDRVGDILAGRMSRAGFSTSGVSANNRIIERHAVSEWTGGYWLSYDFSSTSADPRSRQNIFANPLGPREAFPNDDKSFLHAGGEVIFALPNGLHAYMLVNANDERLDKAPTAIVTDPTRPDHAVEAGLSCYRCHNHGMILKQDAIRGYVDANPDFFPGEVNVLQELYAGAAQNFALQRQDLNAYLTTVTRLGVDLTAPEPITFAAHDFEADVDLRRLAAELYLSKAELAARVRQNAALRHLIGALAVDGSRVKRDYVVENFAQIAPLVSGTR